MDDTTVQLTNKAASSQRNVYIGTASIIVLCALALGAYYFFLQDLLRKEAATHADFYSKLATENNAFVEGEKLFNEGKYAASIPYFEDALVQTSDEGQQLKIKLKIGAAKAESGLFMGAVSILKEVVAMSSDPLTARGRATAAEKIAELNSRGLRNVNIEIFKDDPYKSLFVPNNPALTLRQLHEYAASIYPLALSELRAAQWYAVQLPRAGETSPTLSEEKIEEYKLAAKQLLDVANDDIQYMQDDGTMPDDLRIAILQRALLVGQFNRNGDMSLGDAHLAFEEAVEVNAAAGAGHDGLARYYFALFLAQTYGVKEKAKIQELLAPLPTAEYATSPVRQILKNAQASSYYRTFPQLVASIDPTFKSYLLSIGWTAEDFDS